MATTVWPGAPVYTSLYRPDSTFPGFAACDIRTSFLDRWPVDQRFRALLPLYPLAFRSLGVIDADVVVSSSSGWAHGVRTGPHTRHVVYCYTPPRWLYLPASYLGSKLKSRALAPLRPPFKAWDRRAAARADRYVAISEFVRSRIRRTYGIDAQVVYPPVQTDKFTPRPRGERLLVVSRLLAYKRVDLVVRAANQLGIGLDIVGTGPERRRLQSLAGPTVTLHGQLPDDEVVALFESCSAFCFPGMEDFGITPVEANAAGKPVVAYAAGGALETLVDGVTGALFAEQTVESLVDAIKRADALETSPAEIAAHARRFSAAAFRQNLLAAV